MTDYTPDYDKIIEDLKAELLEAQIACKSESSARKRRHLAKTVLDLTSQLRTLESLAIISKVARSVSS